MKEIPKFEEQLVSAFYQGFMIAPNDPDDTFSIALTAKDSFLLGIALNSLRAGNKMREEEMDRELDECIVDLSGRLGELIFHQKIVPLLNSLEDEE